MTAHCRPLAILLAALSLPACLQMSSSISPIEPEAKTPDQSADAARRTQFAELISRPGTVLLTKPYLRESTSPSPPADPVKVAAGAEGATTPPTAGPETAVVPVVPTPEPSWLAAARAFSDGKPDRAMELLGPLDKTNQDLVLELMPVLARVSSVNFSKDPSAAAVLAEQLHSAANRIEPRAALKLERALLCQSVDGFGRYNPWPRGQPHRTSQKANLYIEVQNLVSQPVADSKGEAYITRASATAEIRDSSGRLIDQPVAGGKLVGVVETEKKLFTRTPVHDFYMLYEFPVPSEPGVYTVTITVKDPVNGRVVKTDPAVEVRVTGP
jgi:hypothetical protein